jgi:hypothetical protein
MAIFKRPDATVSLVYLANNKRYSEEGGGLNKCNVPSCLRFLVDTQINVCQSESAVLFPPQPLVFFAGPCGPWPVARCSEANAKNLLRSESPQQDMGDGSWKYVPVKVKAPWRRNETLNQHRATCYIPQSTANQRCNNQQICQYTGFSSPATSRSRRSRPKLVKTPEALYTKSKNN